MSVLEAPIFRPTEEEWNNIDPLTYIQSIRAKCHGSGIAKIIPPAGWTPHFSMKRDKELSTRLQRIDRLGAHARNTEEEGEDDILENEDILAVETQDYEINSEKKKKRSKKCTLCSVKADLDKMMECAECKGRVHLYCLTPPLTEMPKEPWICTTCVEYKKQSFGFGFGMKYTLDEYQKRGDQFKREYFGLRKNQRPDLVDRHKIEKIFWKVVQKGKPFLEVEYGSELDVTELGSGFPLEGPYGAHHWNLNNLARAQGSVLRHLDDIAGITIPWLYIGMLFSSFCWHNEDHYTYSISYNHRGAPKQWYGIPGDNAHKFETMMKKTYPKLFEKQPDLLYQLVTLVAPTTLRKHGVKVTKAIHMPGEFIVTFPQAYHAGFNYGFNVAEAVNFAAPDWISWGTRAVEHYRNFRRVPVFSHDELLVRIGMNSPSVETCAWLQSGLRRLRDSEYYYRFNLVRSGLNSHARWPKEKLKSELPAKPRKRKYRNIVHKNDWKNSNDSGVEKGVLYDVSERELGGFLDSAENDRCMEYIKSEYGNPNGNSQHHCAVCKYPLYVSAVFCPCSPYLACLKHAKSLCSCPLKQKHVRYRFSLYDLDNICSEVEKTLSKRKGEEKVRAIVEESTMVFQNEVIDQKTVTNGERELLAQAEDWKGATKQFLNDPEKSTREELKRLLQIGRSFIWGSVSFHPFRRAYRKLLDLEVAIRKIQEYAKASSRATSYKSMDKDRRPVLEDVEEWVEKAKRLPDSLRGQEAKQVNGMLKAACEVRERLAAAVENRLEFDEKGRPKKKPTWDAVGELIADARQSPFAISLLYDLQDKMDQVKEWLKEHNDITKDAELHTCFESTMRTIEIAAMGGTDNRKMRLKRKRSVTSIEDFQASTRSRTGRTTYKRCKQLLKHASRLPVTLEKQKQDLQCLIGSAEAFAASVSGKLSSESRGTHRTLSKLPYMRFCRDSGCPLICKLHPGVDDSEHVQVCTVEELLAMHSQAQEVALITTETECIEKRLVKTVEWRKAASDLLHSLHPTDCCQASWDGAKQLLKEYNDAKLNLPPLANALEHILSWQLWSQRVDSATRGLKDLKELDSLNGVVEHLLVMESNLEWPRKTKKFRSMHPNPSLSEVAGSVAATKNLSHHEKLQRALQQGKELEEKALWLGGRNVTVYADERVGIRDLKAFLKAVSVSKYTNVGEDAVTDLITRGQEWIGRARDALPSSYLNIKDEKKPSPKMAQQRLYSIREVQDLEEQARELHLLLPHRDDLNHHVVRMQDLESYLNQPGNFPSAVSEMYDLFTQNEGNVTALASTIPNLLKSRIESYVKRIRDYKALIPSAKRVLRLHWAVRVFVGLATPGIQWQKLKDLIKKEGKNAYISAELFKSMHPLTGDAEWQMLYSLLYYAWFRLQERLQLGREWLEKYQKTVSKLESIQALDALEAEANELDIKFLEAAKIPILRRKCKDWLLRARRAFPNILADETMGLMFDAFEDHAPRDERREELKAADPANLEVAKLLLADARALHLDLGCLEHLRSIADNGGWLLRRLDSMFHPRPRSLSLRKALRTLLLAAPVDENKKELVRQRFGDNLKDEKGQELYCVCRRGDLKTVPMVGCDFCDEWYHLSCINIPAAKATSISSDDQKFRCPKCCMKEKIEYSFGSPTITIAKPKFAEVKALVESYGAGSEPKLNLPELQMLKLVFEFARDGLESFVATLRRVQAFESAHEHGDSGLKPFEQKLVEEVKAAKETVRKFNLCFEEEVDSDFYLWRADVRLVLSTWSDFRDLEDLHNYFVHKLSNLLAPRLAVKTARGEGNDAKVKAETGAQMENDARNNGTDNNNCMEEEKEEGKVKEDAVKPECASQKPKVGTEHMEREECEESKEEELDDGSMTRSVSTRRKRRSTQQKTADSRSGKTKKHKSVSGKSSSGSLKDAFYDSIPEMKALRDTLAKARKVRAQARKGLQKKWKPDSNFANRFLESCKKIPLVEIKEVEQLKAKVQVYCVCRSVYNEGVFMIGCDSCGEWYHPKCIGLSESKAKGMDDFICTRCTS